MGKDLNRLLLASYKSPGSEKDRYAYYPLTELQNMFPISKKEEFYYFSIVKLTL